MDRFRLKNPRQSRKKQNSVVRSDTRKQPLAGERPALAGCSVQARDRAQRSSDVTAG
jgi:hypothetical protein